MPHNVTISEAARVLGVSRRTVQRRIAAGQLSTVDADGARYVVLEDTEVAQAVTQRTPAAVTDIEHMRAELDELRADRDRWRDMAGDLQRNVSELTATLYRVSEQRALSAPTEESTDAPRPAQRPWWRFWVR